MAARLAWLQRLFEPPGQWQSAPATLFTGAAACHRRLLLGLAAGQRDGRDVALGALLEAVALRSSLGRTAPILNHPLLVDALHALASEVGELRAWDDATIPPDPRGPPL